MQDDCDVTCEDCGEDVAPPGALGYDGALISCLACRSVSQVSADSEGVHMVWVAAPCCSCGRLTTLGDPCEPWCGEETVNRVRLT